MLEPTVRLNQFVAYVRTLKGDEKGEAQVFCDRLFQAFGHDGYKEAGATLEERLVRKGKHTKFIDLIWRPRLIIEMKSRKENLRDHYQQVFEYWLHSVPHRPRYVVLCNFDEFWIYEFDEQMEEPMDRVRLEDLPRRFTALNFLFPDEKKPLFGNNRVAVTRAAADKLAVVFNSIERRLKDRPRAQRFILQCLVAMVSEDVGLLPRGIFLELLEECDSAVKSYDLIGDLFRQMNSRHGAGGGRYRDVPYFDGGLFQVTDPVELTSGEVLLLMQAAQEDWGKVQPAIFGSLFQSSMGKKERHAQGAHFTSEADIQKVVLPTITRPFRQRLEAARTLKELHALRDELQRFRVLDPACGSGNFLYVAYRELSRIGLDLLSKIYDEYGEDAAHKVGTSTMVTARQFHGIDNVPFAVELARVTLALAKEFSLLEARDRFKEFQADLLNQALPFDNLDDNVRCQDALFEPWPKVDAIIGNPPFQSKNKMQKEFGRAYLNKLRTRYPSVPGRADYCVYWFKRAQDELPDGGRAGLVGTNTIRQNYSREGGLDYIVGNGGVITEAVSSQVWSGEAVVHVSVVNWLKNGIPGKGPRKLFLQLGDNRQSPWEIYEVPIINSALSPRVDVTSARALSANTTPKTCFQGQTHGHEGFLLERESAESLILKSPQSAEVLFPYLTGDEMLSSATCQPARYVIDFHPRNVVESSQFPTLFRRVKELVLPDREKAAKDEEDRNQLAKKESANARVNHHHAQFLSTWWLLSYPRADLIAAIRELPRYIVCVRVTKRPIFEFVDASIRPNDALTVFALADDYSFGILQSQAHWAWFLERCSTLKADFRYTSNTVYNCFPWPQKPSVADVKSVAKAARELRALRRKLMDKNNLDLRELYRTAELPGDNPLKDAQQKLDLAVGTAFGMTARQDPLAFILKLNLDLSARQEMGEPVQGPGLPAIIKDPAPFISLDRIQLL
jgi:SAM-dependent methyltransferase